MDAEFNPDLPHPMTIQDMPMFRTFWDSLPTEVQAELAMRPEPQPQTQQAGPAQQPPEPEPTPEPWYEWAFPQDLDFRPIVCDPALVDEHAFMRGFELEPMIATSFDLPTHQFDAAEFSRKKRIEQLYELEVPARIFEREEKEDLAMQRAHAKFAEELRLEREKLVLEEEMFTLNTIQPTYYGDPAGYYFAQQAAWNDGVYWPPQQ